MIEIAHQRGAGITVDHALGGATHVDVDDVGSRALGDTRAFGHPAGIASGKLHPVDADPLPVHAHAGVAATLDQALARGHFRYDQTSAKPRCHAPERRIGDAAHGGQEYRVRQTQGADGEFGAIRGRR